MAGAGRLCWQGLQTVQGVGGARGPREARGKEEGWLCPPTPRWGLLLQSGNKRAGLNHTLARDATPPPSSFLSQGVLWDTSLWAVWLQWHP